MLSRSCLISLFILLLSCYQARAQRVLTSEIKSLSNNYITAITKDANGLAWIGTQKSLVTFDGYTVKEIPFFRNMWINCFAYDSLHHVLWIGSSKGLYKFNCNTREVLDCTVKSRAKAVTGIALSGDHLYVSFFRGRIMLIEADGHVKQIASIKGSPPALSGNRIACDRSGNLYIAPDGCEHLLSYNPANNGWKTWHNIPLKNIRNITASENLLLINKGEAGCDIFDMSTGNKLQLPGMIPGQGKSNRSVTLCNRKVYIHDLDRSMLTITDPVSGQATHMKVILEAGKSPKEAICLYADRNEVIWSGTNRGLVKLVIYHLPAFHELLNKQPRYSIRQMIEHRKNEFYICTYQGLFSYDANREKTTKIKTQLPGGAQLPNARTILDHPDGYIYFGAESVNNPLYRYDKKKQVFESGFYTQKENVTDSFFVLSLEKDRNGLIWIGTNKGLMSYNDKSHLLQPHHGDQFDAGLMDIVFLRSRKNGEQIYGAGNKGIFLLDPDKGITERINSSTTPSLKDEETLFAADDDKGNTWIGSRETGIQVISKDRKNMSVLSVNEGLSSNEVYSIVWQDPGTAWVSTSNGLCRYHQDNKGFNNYFADDGLADNEFNQNAYLRSSDGTFYFGGINGITYFKPDEIPVASRPFTIFSSTVSKWNEASADFSDAALTDNGTGVNMKSSDHLLTFSLGASDHSFPEKVMFFYNIEGIYNNWISLGNDHMLRLEGLTAGDHVLKIKAYNKDGIPASNVLQYRIHITQVFFKTWWFFALLSLAAAGLVYLYFYNRLRNLQKLQQLRAQISRNLHDEVGSLLTEVILSADNGRYKSGTMEAKDKRFEKVSSLSRLATDAMSDVLWAIDSRNDHTGDLIDRMREHAEEMFAQADLEWSFDLGGTNQEHAIKPEIRQNLYLIFKEALNNILKHSHADTVQITYRQSAGQFELIIRNNHSQARNSTSQHQGQGLKNMALRAKTIGAVAAYTNENDWFTVHVKSV